MLYFQMFFQTNLMPIFRIRAATTRAAVIIITIATVITEYVSPITGPRPLDDDGAGHG